MRYDIFPFSFYQFSRTLFYETPILFGKTLYNLAKLNFLAKVGVFAKLCISIPNRHVISGIKKAQKERLTSRSGEPLYIQMS